MALPDVTKAQVKHSLDALYERRVPAHVRDEVRLGYWFPGNAVTLFETRPNFRDRTEWIEINVAQFASTPSRGSGSSTADARASRKNSGAAGFGANRHGSSRPSHGREPLRPTRQAHSRPGPHPSPHSQRAVSRFVAAYSLFGSSCKARSNAATASRSRAAP